MKAQEKVLAGICFFISLIMMVSLISKWINM